MAEKPKNANGGYPFGSHLRPTEEIQWMILSRSRQSVLREGLYTLFGVLALTTIAIFMAAQREVIRSNSLPGLLHVLSEISPLGAMIAVPLVLILFFMRESRIYGYAVTNERLLHYKREVSSMALEDIPSITLLPGTGQAMTLNFGSDFPAWPDVIDAVSIKHMIEEAQKQRMQEIAL
jgi:hypothetical protein